MTGLRYGVLGPLMVWRDQQPVRLGPLQQQVVLGVLLVRGDRPYGLASMIDAVWGDAAPGSAVNLVQRHVSALRRTLEPHRAARAQDSRLAWTTAGYRLALAGDSLDLDDFEAGLRAARTAREAGDHKAAADALRAALGLWRGPLCDGLSSPLLDAERDRMADRRLTALQDRIDLDLGIAADPSLIDELHRLIAEHPLRERLHELLMLALHRTGRRADALAAYQRVRRLLHDDLGVEPAAGLQRLHRRILEGDPAPAEPPARVSVPAQLPHAPANFVGREAELAWLDVLLPDEPAGAVVAAISGTAGVGKTTLAVHWAHRVRDHFPDGQLYANLRGFDPNGPALDPGRVVRGFLQAFAVPPERVGPDTDSQAALFRSIVAGKRVLVVLDNARDAEQVRPLLPASPGSMALVTSRDQMLSLVAINGARTVPVGLMTVDEAHNFLVHRLGRQRVDAEPAAADEIIARCARLPLALSVVTAQAAAHPQFPLAAVAADLRRAHGRLDAFDGGDLVTDVRAVFACSYRGLTSPGARLFRLLGLHAGPEISVLAAAGLAAEPVASVRAHLGELARAHLIAERSPGRFAQHDLLRAYAAELAEQYHPIGDRRAVVRRDLDHHLHSAYAADRMLNPFRDDPIVLEPAASGVRAEQPADHQAALAWFAAEEPVLLALLRHAAGAGFDTHAWQLAWTLTQFLDREGHWHDAAAIQERALEATRRLGDPRGEAVSRGCLAYACIRLHRLDEAREHLQRALQLYETLDEHTGMGHVHRTMTWLLDSQGRYGDALPEAYAALELFRRGGNRTGQARALNAIGWFHSRLGRLEAALDHCTQGLALLRETGDRFDQGDTLDSLGRIHHQLGQYDRAAACYREAIELYAEFGDRYDEGNALVALGDAQADAGDSDGAAAAWRRAVHVLDELGHPSADGVRGRLDDLLHGRARLSAG
ncbi:tetratricopeptide repeat protein [Actinoplanes sp. TBRC 11911]|uniref:AfsR/SARP family transcriptional regulator n=1 Tax=Actinoplanes sp. TBRC 11911 TaxID=2729386 RepID=UPI00145CF78E|nr:BTAD domain-containing putative transcriptional regulator [Actinoplanes sp. TBRC 11911]NMO52474.1 tetratricopeptide repeat protein [Actinoplanes sp. TBRC 11911]